MNTYLKVATALLAITLFAFTATPPEKKPKTITAVIDVSHGGTDAGMQHNLLVEKEIVRQIAEKMANLNKNQNLKLHFTRKEDQTVSLHNRVGYINAIQPDVVLSLHINANDKESTSGVSVFYSENGAHTQNAQQFANRLVSAFEADGVFSTTEPRIAPFYILKNSEAPAVVVELGYLTNPHDSKQLQDEAYQDHIAKTLLSVIEGQ
ncbi:MAG TPA: hypothetical protein EYN07_04720 [Flavobacteriaceae bacterium]|nr:hypothetical protein [Flavobacteriaceae bacterium]HIN98527.1 hypothetical protein [Flavobacteriaceae bacterium]